jgi:hypothetical protein
VLDLHQQRVLLAQRALELFALLPVDADVDQRREPVAGRAVVVLDDIRIGVDDGGVLAAPFDLERSDEIGGFDDRGAEFARRRARSPARTRDWRRRPARASPFSRR